MDLSVKWERELGKQKTCEGKDKQIQDTMEGYRSAQ